MRTKKSEAVSFLDSLIGEPETFGGLLRAIRTADEITQEDFAAKIGMTKSHLSDIENGRKFVSIERAAKFALALGYSIPVFIGMVMQEEMNRALKGQRYKIELVKITKNVGKKDAAKKRVA